MASLIVHGDLNADEPAIPEPVYVRPILRSDAPDWVPNPGEDSRETACL